MQQSQPENAAVAAQKMQQAQSENAAVATRKCSSRSQKIQSEPSPVNQRLLLRMLEFCFDDSEILLLTPAELGVERLTALQPFADICILRFMTGLRHRSMPFLTLPLLRLLTIRLLVWIRSQNLRAEHTVQQLLHLGFTPNHD